MIEKFLALWCRYMHAGAMWPIHGRYICRQCLRVHRLDWEEVSAAALLPSRTVAAASASMDVCA